MLAMSGWDQPREAEPARATGSRAAPVAPEASTYLVLLGPPYLDLGSCLGNRTDLDQQLAASCQGHKARQPAPPIADRITAIRLAASNPAAPRAASAVTHTPGQTVRTRNSRSCRRQPACPNSGP